MDKMLPFHVMRIQGEVYTHFSLIFVPLALATERVPWKGCTEGVGWLALRPLCESLSIETLSSSSHLSALLDHSGMFASFDGPSIPSLLIWFDITFLNPA